MLEARTIHGRNLAHLAAAANHVTILHEILLLSAQHNANVLTADSARKTPADIALMNDTQECERVIRNFVYKKRTGTLRNDASLAQLNPAERTLKKSRAKSAQPQFLREGTMSPKSTRWSELVSSGYHTEDDLRMSRQLTQESIATRRTDVTVKQRQQAASDTDEKPAVDASTPRKRVKFKKRVKSAPANPEQCSTDKAAAAAVATPGEGHLHEKCASNKPFMAFRSVPEDELRPLAVEYVPMPPAKQLGLDQRSRERQVMSRLHDRCSSSGVSSRSDSPMSHLFIDFTDDESVKSDAQTLSFRSAASPTPEVKYSWRSTKPPSVSAVDERRKVLDKRRKLLQQYSRPAQTTKRELSAKYYKASYHIRREREIYYEHIPPPRSVLLSKSRRPGRYF